MRKKTIIPYAVPPDLPSVVAQGNRKTTSISKIRKRIATI